MRFTGFGNLSNAFLMSVQAVLSHHTSVNFLSCEINITFYYKSIMTV